ncbi:MAG: S8 family serine peptidase [Candidatus Aminicenantes bacterium]|nr:S8 family serine peptidase [Candidatus Aminicenantes bacterium]
MRIKSSFLGDPYLIHLRLPSSIPTEKAIEILKNNPNVEYAEPNYVYKIMETIPNDPYFPLQWALRNTGQTGGKPGADIKATFAWDIFTGSQDVVVAVIDTGIDYNHVDLFQNIWINTDEIPNNGIDDDNNGFTDDYKGWNFVSNNNDPMDDNYPYYHGTHVAGIVGAKGNNVTGVSGVNWNVKIMPLKAADSIGQFTTKSITNAIDYAWMNGCRISNNSYGGPSYDYAIYSAIYRAYLARHIFVAAAGNYQPPIQWYDNDKMPVYPSCYNLDNIISVLATDYNDNISPYSHYGKISVDVGAPGGTDLTNAPYNIYSTKKGNDYRYLAGTSMAAPYVTGIAALALGKCYALTVGQLKSRIISKVDPLPSLSDKCVSGGRVNAYKVIYDPVAPDGAPDNLVATPTGWTTIRLTWRDNSSNEIGFEVQRKDSAMPDYSYLDGADANRTYFDDCRATAGHVFFYRLRAYNMAGFSTFTNEISTIIPATPPVAPSYLNAQWDWGQRAVHLIWVDSSNNEESFTVERKADWETEWQSIAILAQNVTSFYDSDVAGDTFYYYRIKVANPLGFAYSDIVSVYIPIY